jgi:hypothetical protein
VNHARFTGRELGASARLVNHLERLVVGLLSKAHAGPRENELEVVVRCAGG